MVGKPNPDALRDLAQKQLTGAPVEDLPQRSAEQLLYELQLHQLELEMQSDELRRANLDLEEARRHYLALYDFAPVGYLSLGLNGLIAEIHQTGAGLLGMARQEILERHFVSFVAPHDADRWLIFFKRALPHADQQQLIELTLKGPEREFPAQLVFQQCLCDDNNALLGMTLTDISQSEQLKKLKLAEQQLLIAAKAFESQEGILITDANNTILRVNTAFTRLTGYSNQDVVGKNPKILSSGRMDTSFYAVMWASILDTGAWEGEIWNRRKDGTVYLENLAVSSVKDGNGNVSHYVGCLTDITFSKEADDKIKQLAFYDALTGLPNRSLLRERLMLALAASHRNSRHGALLLLDLDNFKTLNDTLGHDRGDILLQQVAERLLACVGEADTVARFGGDEFVLLLEDLSEAADQAIVEIERIGQQILETFNQLYSLAGYEYRSTPSIGITLFNGQKQTPDALLKQADIALYQAKAAGRNTLCFFDVQMQTQIENRVALERDLRLAVIKNQFTLYYQPQVLHNRANIGAEALIRWFHPERGMVSPADFIPLAEDTGLIVPIGRWVLEAACDQLKMWQQSEQARHLQLAVNVSARQFHQGDFVAQVHQALSRSGINPVRLKLELTESLVLDDINDTIEKMHALRKIGVCFSMDDFGTGYSSLSSLKKLPLDQLKIDQSFVRDIAADPDDAVIVQTIIAMAKSFAMEVIAEGVETELQRAFLEQHGCMVIQGYLTGRPMPLAEFEALVKGSPALR